MKPVNRSRKMMSIAVLTAACTLSPVIAPMAQPAAAATAVGVMSKHLAQLKAFVDDALG